MSHVREKMKRLRPLTITLRARLWRTVYAAQPYMFFLRKGQLLIGKKTWTFFCLLPNGHWFPGGLRQKVSWCREAVLKPWSSVRIADVFPLDAEGKEGRLMYCHDSKPERIRFRFPLAVVWNYAVL